MFLTRLVYTSTVSEDFSPTDIEEILVSARKNNSSACITGMLCFNRKYFLQCLEGSRANVNYIYYKILNDPRHSNILMLNYQEIDVREFSEWSMGYIPESSLTTPTNIKFSGSSEFNPYAISGASAYKMMLALKDFVPAI